ncbi:MULTISPECIES: DASH family cryptochrome [unclassified Pseudoalteromonas]|uniref:DASH family cryptochrome n=1 Tax=unclassified Pseudoalteromonas TaxID=194690 RepID=UPI00042A427E|nr:MULTISPECIES: DASH family cryptochrome [unclassified Pseudoalteromonas]MBH0061905.1 DASH family cryptochrome [Pseudoalteromonas sp. NZS71]
MSKRILYWLQNDLRLTDNPILSELATEQCALDIVFVINPHWFKNNNYQQKPYGVHKQQFLMQSLYELQQALIERGQTLHVLEGEPVSLLKARINEQNIDEVVYSEQFGLYEQRQINLLKAHCPNTKFAGSQQDTLFKQSDLPFDLSELPKHFTPFRKKVEAATSPISLSTLPNGLLPQPITLCAKKPLERIANNGVMHGGFKSAQTHLKQYFSGLLPSTYKITRNELDGFNNTTKFSTWLALGCVSARQVYKAVEAYEHSQITNESTYWIKFELLWREYFKWHALKAGKSLFSFKGQKQTKPLTTFMPNRFAAWCNGSTPYPLVNAIMNELNATGYISNRARQIAASCLVNELGLDWRYGAAYFEQQLIDYDVAANWGNWQYIAGVGVDPRGGRHFNIEKQTLQFDPHAVYTNKWQGNKNTSTQLDNVNEVDWPI